MIGLGRDVSQAVRAAVSQAVRAAVSRAFNESKLPPWTSKEQAHCLFPAEDGFLRMRRGRPRGDAVLVVKMQMYSGTTRTGLLNPFRGVST